MRSDTSFYRFMAAILDLLTLVPYVYESIFSVDELSRAVKQGFLSPNQPAFDKICEKNDVGLFNAIMDDRNHVLNHLFPPVKHGAYNLRQRKHNRIIPDLKDSLFRKTFINRMIFRHSY